MRSIHQLELDQTYVDENSYTTQKPQLQDNVLNKIISSELKLVTVKSALNQYDSMANERDLKLTVRKVIQSHMERNGLSWYDLCSLFV